VVAAAALVDFSNLDELEKGAFATADVATETVEVELREIKLALLRDAEFFVTFFLADQLDMPVPEFHKEIWSLLTDQQKERILLAIPRDHAKTTLAKLIVVWYWLFTSHRFAVYLSNTAPIAKGACRDIMAFLEHPNFVEVFGPIQMLKSSENEGLWIFNLTQANGQVKRCALRAIGQGQQMRGINIDNQRPDIAVIDDVEDNENTESETQQKKLDRWMFGPFLKALARKKKILWLGNMLTKTSLLARLSRKAVWNPVVFGCLVKDVVTGALRPLWEGKWTVAALKEDFKEYKDLGLVESWMCEMMNMPGHGENGFTAEQINYLPLPSPDDCQACWITVDPAFGVKAHNDESSIAVHAIPKDGSTPRTVAIEHGHWDDVELFNNIFALAQYWNAWAWGVEAVAAQRVLITLFNLLLAQKLMAGKAEIVPLMAGRGDPKAGRIRSYVSLMANGEWGIFEGDVDITEQILNYDFRLKDQADDIIDSCAYGPFMHEQFNGLIMAMAAGMDLDSDDFAQYGTEVCGV
jgi:hypothetical protein